MRTTTTTPKSKTTNNNAAMVLMCSFPLMPGNSVRPPAAEKISAPDITGKNRGFLLGLRRRGALLLMLLLLLVVRGI